MLHYTKITRKVAAMFNSKYYFCFLTKGCPSVVTAKM